MIQAALAGDGQTLMVRAGALDTSRMRTLPGVRKARGRPDEWEVPVDLDVLHQLRAMGAMLDDQVTDIFYRLSKVQRWIEATKVAGQVEPLKPPPLKPGVRLYQHQVRAYNLALVLQAFAALMDMGTGKSITTVAVAGRRFVDGKIKRLLVVAPTSVVAVWPREFDQFAAFPHRVGVLTGTKERRLQVLRQLAAPPLPGEPEPLRVAVINYESTWRLIDELLAFAPDMVVCDESQRIKNHSAEQSKALHKIGETVRYRMILTGTPVQNNPLDFFSQYKFLNPAIFGTNYYSFRNRYALMGGPNNHMVLAYKNLEELTRKAHSIAYRVTKEECLDLPEQTFETRYVELPKQAADTYRQIKRDSYAALASGEVTANNVLLRMLRLQQLTGGYLKLDADDKAKPNNTAKLDALRDILEDYVLSAGGKLVIFARFVPEITAIGKLLDKLKIGHAAIWGDIPIDERGPLVQRFQTDPECKVFVAQIQTAGLGITLTAANTAVYYSLDFNLAAYQQSLARIHRIGQRNACTYIHLVVPGTIDQLILDALGRKEELARSVVDNWQTYFEEE